MPRLTRLRTAALGELAHELRFAPPEALARNLDRIEALVAEIDPAAAYPVDWVAFKVTAFRREMRGVPVTIPGRDLIAELPGLAERLSAAAQPDATTLAGRGAIDRTALCGRWRVSPKTLERYKRLGLIGRRAVGARGRVRLVFMPEVVSWFERTHPDLIERASQFSRLGPALEARMVRRASRYRRRFGCTRSQIAKRLAERFDRSHEAVRQLLRRAGRDHAGAAEFVERGAVSRREGKVALRALARGLDPAEIAARWHRTRVSIARAALVARSERLWSLIDTGQLRPGGGSADHGRKEDPALASEVVVAGLGSRGHSDVLELIRTGRVRSVIVGVEESARVAALAALLHRAAVTVLATSRNSPTLGSVDLAETTLRWAVLVKIELMRSQIPMMIETLEGLLGAPLVDMPGGLTSATIKDLLAISFRALGEAVDQLDPAKSGRPNQARLAAAATLAITRAASKWVRTRAVSAGSGRRAGSGNGPANGGSPVSARASGRLLPGVVMADWTLSASAWQSWLWPDARFRSVLPRLDPPRRLLLARRFGWSGRAPQTLLVLAKELGTTVARASTLERQSVRSAFLVCMSDSAALDRP